MMRRVCLAATMVLTGCTSWLDTLLSTRANPYDHVVGYETFSFAYAGTPGELDCQLVWAVTGEPARIPENCVGCEFVFDVQLAYDAGPQRGASFDDSGVCADLAKSTGSYRYAYSKRYDALLVSYDAVYYLQWLDATWEPHEDKDGGRLTYGGGVRDVDLSAYDTSYAGYYYTYYWYGVIDVIK